MTGINSKRRSLLGVLTVANLVFLLLLYASERFIAERCWLTTLVTYAPQQLFGLPVLVLLVWSVGRRHWKIASMNAVAMLFFLVAVLGFSIPLHSRDHGAGPSVRVMTYNIHHMPRGVSSIADEVKAARVDVVCFQEANSDGRGRDPKVELTRLLTGWNHVSSGELAVFSRFPITGSKVHYPPVELSRVYLEVGLNVRGRRLIVIALHLSTAADASSLAHHHGSTASYLRGSTRVRSQQVNAVLEIARGIAGPIVIAGDFNTPPRGRIYRRIAGSFKDCFAYAGWGFGNTFRSDLPVMRIDYIWAGDGLAPLHAEVLPLKGSDHRPVIADVCFTK